MAQEATARPLTVVEDAETGNRFVVYTTRTGMHLELQFDGEEPWFTQKDLAQMYGVSLPNVNEHIAKFMAAGEIDGSVIRNFRITARDGKTYDTKHYGLDVAFYVGYRVNSTEGKLFRRWATQVLVQLAKYGFVIDKRALRGDADRLSELRRIIQDLRADEANVYAELRRIIAMCKDYNPTSKSCRDFFANFQNRLLYAITGHTAAEIIVNQANAIKPNMGLQAWKGDYPLQEDTTTAKNYLGELQIEDLNRLTTMVLDFFEDQTKRGWLVSMSDADTKLGEILAVNKRLMLVDLGKVSASKAEAHAKAQYKIFDTQRRDERKRRALVELNEKAKKLPRRGKLAKKE